MSWQIGFEGVSDSQCALRQSDGRDESSCGWPINRTIVFMSLQSSSTCFLGILFSLTYPPGKDHISPTIAEQRWRPRASDHRGFQSDSMKLWELIGHKWHNGKSRNELHICCDDQWWLMDFFGVLVLFLICHSWDILRSHRLQDSGMTLTTMAPTLWRGAAAKIPWISNVSLETRSALSTTDVCWHSLL